LKSHKQHAIKLYLNVEEANKMVWRAHLFHQTAVFQNQSAGKIILIKILIYPCAQVN